MNLLCFRGRKCSAASFCFWQMSTKPCSKNVLSDCQVCPVSWQSPILKPTVGSESAASCTCKACNQHKWESPRDVCRFDAVALPRSCAPTLLSSWDTTRKRFFALPGVMFSGNIPKAALRQGSHSLSRGLLLSAKVGCRFLAWRVRCLQHTGHPFTWTIQELMPAVQTWRHARHCQATDLPLLAVTSSGLKVLLVGCHSAAIWGFLVARGLCLHILLPEHCRQPVPLLLF